MSKKQPVEKNAECAVRRDEYLMSKLLEARPAASTTDEPVTPVESGSGHEPREGEPPAGDTAPQKDDRKPVEEWAVLLEHVNVAPIGREPIDVAKQKAWMFDATKIHKQWIKGQSLTREEYEASVASMMGIPLG